VIARTKPPIVIRNRIEAVRAEVFTRDRGRCRLQPPNGARGAPGMWLCGAGQCFGSPLTFHHLRKSSQGGPYIAANGLTLCGFHNEWVEDRPKLAHTWGLVIRTGEGFVSTWARLQLFGLTDWWWDGTPAAADPPATVPATGP